MKDFIRYVTLSILGTLGVSCYIIADTFFISKGLGVAGLTALNLALPVYNVIFGIAQMLGMGGATKFSILKGMRHHEEANLYYSQTMMLAVVSSLFFVGIGVVGAKSLAELLGANEETLELTTIYLRMLLLFTPAFMVNSSLQYFVRNDNAPKLVMFAQIFGSFANIVLDYIFIFPLNMGMFGAILATCLSPMISIAIMSIHWIQKKNTFRLIWKHWRGQNIGQIMSLGFPSLLGQISGGIVIVVFNMLILGIEGNVGVAAYGVVANISIVVTALYTGLAQGMQPLLSTAYGTQDHIAIKKTMNYGYVTMAGISLLMYAVLYFFATQVTTVFNSEGDVILQEIAESGLKIYFLSNVFLGFNTVVATYFTSVERALPAQVLSILRGLIFIIPFAFIMSSLWGMNGIWISFPATEAVTAILGSFLYLKMIKK